MVMSVESVIVYLAACIKVKDYMMERTKMRPKYFSSNPEEFSRVPNSGVMYNVHSTMYNVTCTMHHIHPIIILIEPVYDVKPTLFPCFTLITR